MKFTSGPSASIRFGNFSNEIAGNDLISDGIESFNVDIVGGAYAFGFYIHEPSYTGTSTPVNGCNTVCVDSKFSVEIFSGAKSLVLSYLSAPNDTNPSVGGPIGFYGVGSNTAFDRIQVREVTGTNDNEFFGGFYLSQTQAVPEPDTTALVLAGGGAAAFFTQRARRPRSVGALQR